MTRIAIYPKDIQNILGRSESTARRIYLSIKDALGKKKDQPVTVKEFCIHLNIKEEEVTSLLK